MKYHEFLESTQFNQTQLLASAWGTLVENPPEAGLPALPGPPLLMFDRITEIQHLNQRGRIVAEQDVLLNAWFFQCHFRSDPVQPGCLGVDAIWQLLGFYAAVRGAKGSGRALGAKEVEFFGQIRPHNKLIQYSVDIRRYSVLPGSKAAMVVGSGEVRVDGCLIYSVREAKVGVFADIAYSNYPHFSRNAFGGNYAGTNTLNNSTTA